MSSATASAQTKSGRGKAVALAVIVILVAAALGAYFLFYPTSAPSTSTINIANGTGSNHSLNFNPATLTVVTGKNNTVVFTNNDVAMHTVTFTSAPSGVSLSTISDSNLAAGTSFTVTLTAAGTYQYHCSIHSWMSGTIVVKS